LYSLIQRFITIENFVLYKTTLTKQCKEGEKAFEAAWKELKTFGYLIQHQMQGAKGHFRYEYELLDEPIHTPKKEGVDKGGGGKGGVYNNTDLNNTDLNNTDLNNILKKIKGSKYLGTCTIDDFEEVLSYYFNKYTERTGKQHPELNAKCCDTLARNLFIVNDDQVYELEPKELFSMIDKHFQTKYRETDWNIMHFANEEIMKMRFFDCRLF